jgi:uncharacterized membrane protein YhaH (DUF805 family)
MMGVLRFLFSFQGRIGRTRYWLLQIVMLFMLVVCGIAVGAVQETLGLRNVEDSAELGTASFAAVAIILAIDLSSHVRRFHDLGRSGWWFLVAFIPLGGIYVLVMSGFVRGDRGANKYGPDPFGPTSTEEWNAAIGRNPKDAVAYNGRGDAYFEKGEYERAIQDYDQVLRLIPNADMAMSNRGFARLKLGRIEEAVSDFEAALRLDPNNEEALYGRGVARLKSGDTAGGNADIAAAKAIRRDIAEQFASYGVQAE